MSTHPIEPQAAEGACPSKVLCPDAVGVYPGCQNFVHIFQLVCFGFFKGRLDPSLQLSAARWRHRLCAQTHRKHWPDRLDPFEAIRHE